jgi:hypothetical protein
MTIELEELKKVKLEPGDSLVLTLAKSMSDESVYEMGRVFHEKFPDNLLIVLHPGYTLEVIAKETA